MHLFENDPEFYRPLIVRLFPDLRHAEINLHESSSCAIIELDKRLIFKFPKDKNGCDALEKEVSLLSIIAPAIKMQVPEMQLHQDEKEKFIFSMHQKIAGEALTTECYRALKESSRKKLAKKIAQFYLQLHCLNPEELITAGADTICISLGIEELESNIAFVQDTSLKPHSHVVIEAYKNLPAAPYANTFCFFNTHGESMAFDLKREVLNGLYGFTKAGFGELHHEFIYTNLIHPELTELVISAYEKLSQRMIDRHRVNVLTSYFLLSEIFTDGVTDQDLAQNTQTFHEWMKKQGSLLRL